MSSFPYVWDANGAPKGDARFYLALFGQAITGIACPFVSSVPTKVDNEIVENLVFIFMIFHSFVYHEIYSILSISIDISTLVWRE